MANSKVPDRLSKEFFTKVLQSSFKFGNTVTVESTNIQLATVAGDNYCSEIYRAKIVFSVLNGGQKPDLQQISLIVKDMPDGENRGQVLEDMKVYERETEMYCNTIPAMSKLLNNEFFCAKCLYATKDPCRMLVFQDLGALHYKMADRKTGLDFAHCQMIMQLLGRFHATSMVLAEKQPDAMAKYKYGMLNPNTRKDSNHIEIFFTGGLDALIKTASKWPGYEGIVEKLRKIRVNFIDRMYKHVETDGDTIRVLNHGDLWVNNIMFKYDDGAKLTNVIFVDYQMCFYSSPAIDLNYFLTTSPKHEVRVNRQSDLVKEYHESLRQTLTGLNYKNIPTLEELEADILRKEFYGLIACIAVLPIVLMEKQSDAGSGMDALLDEKSADAVREICFGGAKYEVAMKYNLKRFDELKVLDVE